MTTATISPHSNTNTFIDPPSQGRSIQFDTRSRRHHTQHVGNYVIYKKTLGSGSMGTVKLAECLSDKDHHLYAVKIMPKVNLNLVSGEDNKNKDPKDTPREREQRTVREMAIMHLLRHPHICQLKEWLVYGENYYMFLEYIEGGQLLDYIISHGKLKEKLARKFARQIVSALDYCHRNSIVHRDLKIENILITNNEEIKIIDFGLSNVYSPSRLLNTFCGSLYFAAPELLQAKYYTGPEVDVWSFGIVLYVLLCGRVPFDDTNLPALHQKIKAGVVEYPDHLSKESIDLLSRILVVDPAKRETLSGVIHHPWMNKFYDEPIFSHLPHRVPLKSIDREVIRGMQGFGLGTPEEIENKLLRIISSHEYQSAAQIVDKNYHSQQQHQMDPHITQNSNQSNNNQCDNNSNNNNNNNNNNNDNLSIANRFKRSLSIRRTNATGGPKQDDPQSLPVIYDPLISIYCLVKERREYDNKIQLLESNGYQSPVQLGRSASTSLSKPIKIEKGLTRRKTERVPPSHTRNLFSDTYNTYSPDGVAVDWASPRSSTDKQLSRSNSLKIPTPTFLQRSKSAAKRLGAMLPSSGRHTNSSSNNNSSSEDQTYQSLSIAEAPNLLRNNDPMENTAHIDSSYSSSLKKTISILRSNSLSERKYKRSPRKQSASSTTEVHRGDIPERTKYGSSAPSSRNDGYYIENALDIQKQVNIKPAMSTYPKSLFNFNRRHLFKVSANDLMKDIQKVLTKFNIYYIQSRQESFTLECECLYPEYLRFLKSELESESDDCENLNIHKYELHDTIRFTVMIYQARWAGGRLGIKVIEAEDEANSDKIYRNIYHAILNEVDQLQQR